MRKNESPKKHLTDQSPKDTTPTSIIKSRLLVTEVQPSNQKPRNLSTKQSAGSKKGV